MVKPLAKVNNFSGASFPSYIRITLVQKVLYDGWLIVNQNCDLLASEKTVDIATGNVEFHSFM